MKYVKHKVEDIVSNVQDRISSEWGGHKVREADQIASNEEEIEYVRVRPAHPVVSHHPSGVVSFLSNNVIFRTWKGLTGKAQDMYDSAAGITNAAGQSWNQAMDEAYNKWQSSAASTRQSWDDAKAAAFNTWSATTSLPRRTYDAAAGSWYNTLAKAYYTYQRGKDKTKENWDDVKRAVWKSWRQGEGKAYSGYDYLKDTAGDMYDSALESAYNTFKSGKDTSADAWDKASSTLRRSWHTVASNTPEDVISDAWDEWVRERESTGETWDEKKQMALSHWHRLRGGESESWSDAALKGWEAWLASAWHLWNRSTQTLGAAQEGGMEMRGVGWPATKEAAKKTYRAVADLGSQTWDQAEQMARDAYDKTASIGSGEWMTSPQRQDAFQRWLDATVYSGTTKSWKDAKRSLDHYWHSTKRNAKEGYDTFVYSSYNAYQRAANAAGVPWSQAQQSVKDYYNSVKHSTTKSLDELTDTAWRDWVATAGGRGADTWNDVEKAAKEQWNLMTSSSAGKKKSVPQMTWDEFLAQTLAMYEHGSTRPSWLHNVSDAIACGWDEMKCRLRGDGDGGGASTKEGEGESGKHWWSWGGGGGDVEHKRREAHQKVEELGSAAKHQVL